MAEFVFILILVFPAILGLSEMLHIFKKWVLASGKSGNRVMIIIPDDKNFQKELMYAFEESKWQGEKLAQKIIVLDTCLCIENKEECALLAKKFGFEVYSKSQLANIEF